MSTRFISNNQSLYKYRRLDTDEDFARIKDILTDGKLWASSISNLNDPFEGAFPDFSTAHGPKMLESIHRKHEVNRKHGIISFSREADNLLLWSHYTNSHRGICIEFDYKNDPTLRQAIKLNYEKHLRSAARKSNRELLLFKSFHWAYEKEYRIITDRPNDSVDFDTKNIVSIIFGKNIEPKRALDLLFLIDELNIRVRRVTKLRNDFRLLIDDQRVNGHFFNFFFKQYCLGQIGKLGNQNITS